MVKTSVAGCTGIICFNYSFDLGQDGGHSSSKVNPGDCRQGPATSTRWLPIRNNL